jgi:hypothetical protein
LNKDFIIINSINKNFEVITFVAQEPEKRLMSITVNFDYKAIKYAKITMDTSRALSEEEIKDKIVEVINS